MDMTTLQKIKDEAASVILAMFGLSEDRILRAELDTFLVEAFYAGAEAARKLDAETAR